MGISETDIYDLSKVLQEQVPDKKHIEFYRPPAIRLYGRLGELREGTKDEKERFQRLVRPVRRTKGYKVMWKDMNRVRELSFERAEGANLGLMTDVLWKDFVGSAVERVVH